MASAKVAGVEGTLKVWTRFRWSRRYAAVRDGEFHYGRSHLYQCGMEAVGRGGEEDTTVVIDMNDIINVEEDSDRDTRFKLRFGRNWVKYFDAGSALCRSDWMKAIKNYKQYTIPTTVPLLDHECPPPHQWGQQYLAPSLRLRSSNSAPPMKSMKAGGKAMIKGTCVCETMCRGNPQQGNGSVDPFTFAETRNDNFAQYLSKYDYRAVDADTWMDLEVFPCKRPETQLELAVREHHERDGHTWYAIECHLVLGAACTLEWIVERRLLHLRDKLHDPVKSLMGSAYAVVFKDARFANIGGLSGTLVRLDRWCRTLASAINARLCSPCIVTSVLLFLRAPEPPNPMPLTTKSDSITTKDIGKTFEVGRWRSSSFEVHDQPNTDTETNMHFASSILGP